MKNQNSTQRRKDAKTPRKNQPSGFWPLSSAFAPLLLCAFALNLFADDSAHIVVSARDFGQSALTRRNVTLTPLAPLRRTVTTNLFSIEPRSLPTDTNGVCTFSNTLWGYYRLDLSGTPGTSFNLVLGTNQSGLVSAAALVTNSVTLPPNPATNYYTMAQADAIHAGITGSGGGFTNNGPTYQWSSNGLWWGTVIPNEMSLADGDLTANGFNAGVHGITSAGGFFGDGSGLTNLSAAVALTNSNTGILGQLISGGISTNSLNLSNRFGGHTLGITNPPNNYVDPYRWAYVSNGIIYLPGFSGFGSTPVGLGPVVGPWPGINFVDTNGTPSTRMYDILDHGTTGNQVYHEFQIEASQNFCLGLGNDGIFGESWFQMGRGGDHGNTLKMQFDDDFESAKTGSGLRNSVGFSGIYTNAGTTNMGNSAFLLFASRLATNASRTYAASGMTGLNLRKTQGTVVDPVGYNDIGGLVFFYHMPIAAHYSDNSKYGLSTGGVGAIMDGSNGWWLNGVLSANGSGLTNLPAAAITAPPWQIGSAALTNWVTDGFLPYYDGMDWRGIYANSGDPTNALIWDSGNLLWRLGTNANQIIAGAFTGNGRGLTNLVAAAALGTNTGNNVGWSLTNGVLALYKNSATPTIILHPNGNQTNSGDFGFGSGVSVIRSTGGAVFGAGISGTSANFSSSLNWGSGNTLSCARFMLGSGSANTMSIFDSTLGSTIPAAASVISNWPTFRISSSNNLGLTLNCSLTVSNGFTNASSAAISTAGGILYTQTNLYDDLIWYPSDINQPGGLTGPTIVATSGRDGESLAAVFNADDASVFIAQMPNVWVPESTLWSHFHIEPQTTAGVTNVWRIKHSIADINGTFPAWTITTNTTTIAPSSQWKHILVAVPTNGIPMTGFAGPSTIIKYRIECISGNVDTHIVAADLHYRVRGSPVPFNPP